MRSLHPLFVVNLLLVPVAAAAVMPATAAVPVEVFAQLPRMSGAQLSPDGEHLAYFAYVDGRRQLIVSDLKGRARPIVAPPVETLNFDWVRWANDDRLVFSMSFFAGFDIFFGSTETRLLSIRKDGTGLVSLVRPATVEDGASFSLVELITPQRQDDVVDWLPDDPGSILLALDADFDGGVEVRRINIDTGDYGIVTGGLPGIEHWVTDTNGALRFGHGYRGGEIVFRLRDNNGDWTGDGDDQWPWGDFTPVAFTEDASVAYVQGHDDTGRSVIRMLDFEKGEFLATQFGHDNADVQNIVTDPATRQAVGVSYVEHEERIEYFDESMQLLQRSMDKALPDTANLLVNMSTDRSRVLVLARSNGAPGTYYLWDRNGKSLAIVGEGQAGLSSEAIIPAEPVFYKARDGALIAAYLTLPPGLQRKDLPAVVLPHRGPRATDAESYWYLAQFLAGRGYAVLQPNSRSPTGYGREFATAGMSHRVELVQGDITDAARWLIAERIGDPNRMCIVGWSYGGYAAAMSSVKTPRLFACAASINGVLDLQKFTLYVQDFVRGKNWSPHTGGGRYRVRDISPHDQAERIATPLLIVQADDDKIVPREQGRRMARRLERLDKPVELVTVSPGGHAMMNEQARVKILRSLEDFLGRHIGSARQDHSE